KSEHRRVELAASGPGALQRITDRTSQSRGIQLRFEQVVLRSQLDSSGSQIDIIQAGQDHHRQVRSLGVHAREGLEILAVGKYEVEQDHIDVAISSYSIESVGKSARSMNVEAGYC